MKKFNWRVLLVVVLSLILCAGMFACNGDTKTKKPNIPAGEPDAYDEPVDDRPVSIVFNELYNASRSIGNEKIEDGKNVYLNMDFALTLGSRSEDKTVKGDGFALGVKLEGLFDRSEQGTGTKVKLALTSGEKTIAKLFVDGECIYAQLGTKKVKASTKLVTLGDLLGVDLGGHTIEAFIESLADGSQGVFNIDTLITVFKEQLGIDLSSIVNALPIAGLKENLYDKDGNFSLREALRSDLILGEFEGHINGNKYTAALKNDGLIGGFIAGDDGKVDLSIDFETENHVFKDGVTVDVDFVVADTNPLKETLATKDGKVLNPYIQLKINHLQFKDGTNKTVALDDNVEEYADNLQFQVYQDISINGITLLLNSVRHLQIGLYGNLDLVNIEDNKTKVRLYANVHSDEFYAPNDPGNYTFLDLIYENNVLAFKVDGSKKAYLASASGMGVVPYQMLLADPIANLIDGILPDAQREEFDSKYWKVRPGTEGKKAEMNEKFQGIVVNNISVADIIGLIGGGSSANEAAAAAAETEAEASASSSILNTIVKVLGIFSNVEDGKFAIKSNSFVDVIANIVGTSTGDLAQTVADLVDSIGFGILGDALSFNRGSYDLSNAETQVDKLKAKLENLFTDVKIDANFNLTDGITWNLDLVRADDYNAFVATKEEGYDPQIGAYKITKMVFDDKTNFTSLSVSHKEASGFFPKEGEETFTRDEIKSVRIGDLSGYKITIASAGNLDVYFTIGNDDIITLYKSADPSTAAARRLKIEQKNMPGTQIKWESKIILSATDFEETFLTGPDVNAEHKKIGDARADRDKVLAAAKKVAEFTDDDEAQALVDTRVAELQAAQDAYDAVHKATLDPLNDAKTAAKAAYDAQYDVISKLDNYGADYRQGDPGYAVKNLDAAIKKWVNAGKQDSGTEWDAYQTSKQALATLLASDPKFDAIEAAWTPEVEALLIKKYEADKAYTDAKAEADATEVGVALKAAKSAKSAADKELTNAQKPIKPELTLLGNWVVIDLKAKA